MKIENCLLCREPENGSVGKPLTEWDKDALKYTHNLWKLCKVHDAEIVAEIERRPNEPVKYILKQKEFVLKTPEKNPPNFQDREPGEDG